MKYEIWNMKYPTIAHFRHFRHLSSLFINDYQISTNSYVRIYKAFMQNKANLRNDIVSVSLYATEIYEENGHSGHQKTKPIQTQFNPKQTQSKPIQANPPRA
ncbi:MAG: hypothetical protein FVQ84_22520 [Planctomycetes bacterium]|nr:hypothetical protein [Planctomycetota bacterium]